MARMTTSCVVPQVVLFLPLVHLCQRVADHELLQANTSRPCILGVEKHPSESIHSHGTSTQIYRQISIELDLRPQMTVLQTYQWRCSRCKVHWGCELLRRNLITTSKRTAQKLQ